MSTTRGRRIRPPQPLSSSLHRDRPVKRSKNKKKQSNKKQLLDVASLVQNVLQAADLDDARTSLSYLVTFLRGDDHNRSLLRRVACAGGTYAVTICMQQYATDWLVQYRGLLSLLYLAQDPDTCMGILVVDGLSLVLWSIENHGEESVLRIAVEIVMKLLSTHQTTVLSKLSVTSFPAMLMHLLETQSSLQLLVQVYELIMTLAEDDGMRRRLQQANGLEILNRVASQHQDDEEVQQFAKGALERFVVTQS